MYRYRCDAGVAGQLVSQPSDQSRESEGVARRAKRIRHSAKYKSILLTVAKIGIDESLPFLTTTPTEDFQPNKQKKAALLVNS